MQDGHMIQAVTRDLVEKVVGIGSHLQAGEAPKEDLAEYVEMVCAVLPGLKPEAPKQAIREFIGQLRLRLELAAEDQPLLVQTLVRAIQLAQGHLDGLDEGLR